MPDFTALYLAYTYVIMYNSYDHQTGRRTTITGFSTITIFFFLQSGLTALEQHCRSLVKYMNTHLMKVGKVLGIERRVTTIVSGYTKRLNCCIKHHYLNYFQTPIRNMSKNKNLIN